MSLLLLFSALTTPPAPPADAGKLEGTGGVTSSLEPVAGFVEA